MAKVMRKSLEMNMENVYPWEARRYILLLAFSFVFLIIITRFFFSSELMSILFCFGFLLLQFVLQYPEEYIIEVKGFYDKITGSKTKVMTMLKFITNMRTSDPFGPEAGEPFTLKLEGHKIVGFHGSSTDRLHKIGVYVTPITN